MGIIVDAASIILGAVLGRIFKSRAVADRNDIFGVGIIIISVAGAFENLFEISDGRIKGDGVLTVVLALTVGYVIGELLRIEKRLAKFSSGQTRTCGFIDACIFFGVGGLQICGPILLGAEGDSSQLYIKALVDFPFAIMFGAIYGISVLFAALPVAAFQALIAVGAYFCGDFISAGVLARICAVGYVILFFSGLNMLSGAKKKISCVNMLPSVPFVAVFGLFLPM